MILLSLSLIKIKGKKTEEKNASCHKEGFLPFLFSDVVGAAIEQMNWYRAQCCCPC